MNEILVSYIEDLRDSILLFNESLINVQNGIKDSETINNIFRVAHTIKGNSAAMNFLKIQNVMHTMEDLLTDVRNGERELSDDIVEVLFACHDFLEDFLDVVQSQSSDESMDTDVLLKRLQDLKNNSKSGDKAAKEVAAEPEIKEAESATAIVSEVGGLMESMDLDIGMPIDIWEILEQNTKSGMSAYKMNIHFMKNSSM